MRKFSLDIKIEIYNEYKNGRALQDLSKEYGMNFSNLRYMVKFIDRYGIEEYTKPSHYPNDLKEYLIQRVLNKEDTTFNIALEGGLKSRTQLVDLVKKYRENGYNIVERKRGRPTMSKKSKQSNKKETIEEENERLKQENEYLKAQLEYSKKLRAVVQSRKNRQQKKK